MAKPFADRAAANAAMIQAATDYQTAQLQARSKLLQSQAKVKGQLQQSLFDHAADAAQERHDMAHDAASGQGVPEDITGPAVQPVPLPQVGAGGASGGPTQLTIDPSQVSGGGGIQAASGINSGGPPNTNYNVPATITSTQQTQGTRPVSVESAFPGGVMQAPFSETSTRTTPNVMTPAQAATLQQNAYFEAQRQRIAEKQFNMNSALNMGHEYGASAAPLMGKLLAGQPLTGDDFKKAGTPLQERLIASQIAQAGAGVEAEHTRQKYFELQQTLAKDANERANKLFDLQREKAVVELAQQLQGTGQGVDTNNLHPNVAAGVTDSQVGPAAQRLNLGLAAYGKLLTPGLKSSVGNIVESDIKGLDYFMDVGAPALNQNLVPVLAQTPDTSISGRLIEAFNGPQQERAGLTTVPFQTFFAEWLAATGKVKGLLSKDRVAQAQQQLKDWGYYDPDKPLESGDVGFMRNTWDRVNSALQQYRGTIVEQQALGSLGIVSTKGASELRVLPETAAGRVQQDINRAERTRTGLENLKSLEETRKAIAGALGQ